jgi:hypothetical protein
MFLTQVAPSSRSSRIFRVGSKEVGLTRNGQKIAQTPPTPSGVAVKPGRTTAEQTGRVGDDARRFDPDHHLIEIRPYETAGYCTAGYRTAG